MTAKDLVLTLLAHSERLHDSWTRERHFIWISGMLADVVLEKNHNDNIVMTRLNARIDRLYSDRLQ